MDKVEANVNTKEELKKASRNKRKRNIIVIVGRLRGRRL